MEEMVRVWILGREKSYYEVFYYYEVFLLKGKVRGRGGGVT